jgi:hypothetical protein
MRPQVSRCAFRGAASVIERTRRGQAASTQGETDGDHPATGDGDGREGGRERERERRRGMREGGL